MVQALYFTLLLISGKYTCLSYDGLRHFAGAEIIHEDGNYLIKTEFPIPELLEDFFTREVEIYDQILSNRPLGRLEKLHFPAPLNESLRKAFKELLQAVIPSFYGKPLQVSVSVNYDTKTCKCSLSHLVTPIYCNERRYR